MSNLYNRKGEPISLEEWCKLFEKRDYKVVQQDQVGKYWISTVWLGSNHNFSPGKPLIFETMVFKGEGCATDERECERYSTEAEALKGHRAMVKKYKLLT